MLTVGDEVATFIPITIACQSAEMYIKTRTLEKNDETIVEAIETAIFTLQLTPFNRLRHQTCFVSIIATFQPKLTHTNGVVPLKISYQSSQTGLHLYACEYIGIWNIFCLEETKLVLAPGTPREHGRGHPPQGLEGRAR